MASDKRIKIKLVCETCKGYFYTTSKNKQNTTEKLNMKKYCPSCRKHSAFKEHKI